MSFGKDSSFVFCMKDNKLISVGRSDVTADRHPLDSIEKEVWRIVHEHKAFQAENERLREALRKIVEQEVKMRTCMAEIAVEEETSKKWKEQPTFNERTAKQALSEDKDDG